ncbi:MAG: MBL fold metallo-hydrolase RNA specificity domain-containing protein, partial [Deltaproteobacteria bacterium]
LAPHKLLIVSTGAQGEPRSGLVRLAFGTHASLFLTEGDRVIFSSRFIPGNELSIAALQNALALRGIDVVAEPGHRVHVSGHAYAEDQKLVLRLTRPQSFIPVHGEARHLRAHRELAIACGVRPERALLALDGDVIELSEAGPRLVQQLTLGRCFVDRWGGGDVPEDVVRDRRLLAESGLVTVVIAIDRASGALLRDPEIFHKGLQPPDPQAFWREAKRAVMEALEAMPPMLRRDGPAVEEAAARAVRRHCKKTLERKPVVMPVLVGL